MEKKKIIIRAKRLGEITKPEFCPRCFQILEVLKWKPAWDRFPGVFSSLDVGQKSFVHGHLDKFGCLPECLKELGDVVGYIEPPSWRDFYFESEPHNMLVRGEADLILKKRNGKLIIVDLKTAAPKGDEDSLWPNYHWQANTYARAAEERGLGEVEELALAYMCPVSDPESMLADENIRKDALAIPFQASVVPVPMQVSGLEDLCGQWRELAEVTHRFEPKEGCVDCKKSQMVHEYFAQPRGCQATVWTVQTRIEFLARHFGM